MTQDTPKRGYENASPEEKREILKEVIHEANEDQRRIMDTPREGWGVEDQAAFQSKTPAKNQEDIPKWENKLQDFKFYIYELDEEELLNRRTEILGQINRIVALALSQRTEEIKKIVKGMRIRNPKCYCKTHPEHNCGITSNEAISDLLQTIDNLHKDE